MPGAGLVLWAFDRPRPAAIGLLVLMIAVAISLPSLRFDSDINRVFQSDSPLSQQQRDFEARLEGRISEVAILIESIDPLTAVDLDDARGTALDLEFVEGVAGVSSPFALRFPPDHPDFPDAPVLPADLIGADIPARLAAFRDLGVGLPTLIDDRALLIGVAVDTHVRPLDEVLPEIRELSSDLDTADLRVAVTGADVASLAIRDGLTSDLARLNLLGTALVALAALALLRDPRLSVVAVVPGVLAALSTLGLAVWLGYPITVLNNVVPVLMLILGVANGLHLTVSLSRATGDLRDRVVHTAETVAPASALTAVTTALAFGSIMLTRNAQLFEFAVLGAASVLLTLALLLLGFGLLTHVLRPAPRTIGSGTQRLATWIGASALNAPKTVAALGLVALLAAGVGFTTTKPWYPLYQDLPAGSVIGSANDRIAERFGGVFQAWVEMPEDADWIALAGTVRAVEEVVPRGTILSELALARWLGDTGTAPSRDALARVPGFVTDRLRDPGTGKLRFAVSMPEPMRSPETLAAFDRLEQVAIAAGAARVLGLPAIMRHESVALIRQLTIGLVLATVSGAVVVAAAFRSAPFLFVVLVVNLLPVLCVGAALHLLNSGQLTPPAILSLTIAFGVAVDDTIHYLARFAKARGAGASVPAAAQSALASAGGVMVMTSILLCVGLSVTALSVFFPVRLFGEMLALSLATALVADLMLLPALLNLRRDHAKT